MSTTRKYIFQKIEKYYTLFNMSEITPHFQKKIIVSHFMTINEAKKGIKLMSKKYKDILNYIENNLVKSLSLFYKICFIIIMFPQKMVFLTYFFVLMKTSVITIIKHKIWDQKAIGLQTSFIEYYIVLPTQLY